MLQAIPTKNGTGVSIYGDYGDLKSLYEAVDHIANTLNGDNKFQKGQHQLLMNFAYEIRKGYSGLRLTEEMRFPGEQHTLHYYGFQLVWTDILIFISTLRHNAGYIQTDRLQQATLYLLEYVIEKALDDYDRAAASEIKNFITYGIPVSNEYSFIIYQAIHIEYVSGKSGKARFKKIPKLLNNYFNTWAPEYKSLIASFEQSAKEQNCEITDLEFQDFPDIKW
ncbi:hypothetical protein HQ865_22630 [Mucilaginibacter mali]|uniref:Uncharacterized protein n=1 Tax=Mucilaginibacter mali TaxID=2740462 RepID=A0A7D4UF74_9SPHI|nr:hypothetical protein [Mucilaginibacter mali]QKJ32439.1 hypothetical protein HQ865_22630 [Mucilaginibacter mali]